jgi:hypothetical protein
MSIAPRRSASAILAEIQGLSPLKLPVRVATTANVTLLGGAPSTVDSIALSTGDRVLCTGQTDPAENGPYYVAILGTGATGTWRRVPDMDRSTEVFGGLLLVVAEGATHADRIFELQTDDPITLGTTALVFARVGGGATSDLQATRRALPYTMAVADDVVVATTSGTLTLPALDAKRRTVIAEAVPVVVQPSGGVTISGDASRTLLVAGETIVLVGDGVKWQHEA